MELKTAHCVSEQKRTRQRPYVRIAGFSLIEVLVALMLVGVLGIVAGGFLLPLKTTQASAAESAALTISRSYLEVLKSRWLDLKSFQDGKLPVTRMQKSTTPAEFDVEIPDGWQISVDNALWQSGDQIRSVKLAITIPQKPSFVIQTEISRPSYADSAE